MSPKIVIWLVAGVSNCTRVPSVTSKSMAFSPSGVSTMFPVPWTTSSANVSTMFVLMRLSSERCVGLNWVMHSVSQS